MLCHYRPAQPKTAAAIVGYDDGSTKVKDLKTVYLMRTTAQRQILWRLFIIKKVAS